MNCPICDVDLSHTSCGLDGEDVMHEHHHPTVNPGLVLSCCRVNSSAVAQLCPSCCLICVLLSLCHGMRNETRGSARTRRGFSTLRFQNSFVLLLKYTCNSLLQHVGHLSYAIGSVNCFPTGLLFFGILNILIVFRAGSVSTSQCDCYDLTPAGN